jgi:hypothetical protein
MHQKWLWGKDMENKLIFGGLEYIYINYQIISHHLHNNKYLKHVFMILV